MLTHSGELLFNILRSPLAAEDGDGISWFTWLLIIIVVILLIWFLWRWYNARKAAQNQAAQATPPAVKAAAPIAAAPAAPAKPDDLTILEGIGPKVAGLLQAAGITTFARLGAADVSQLTEILKNAGLQYLDPGTWPEQARLAAAGKMDELKAFTDSLKGGRKAS
jgi:predicted flap endonuclease-1-like 5' DNA nuclease